MSVEPTKPPKNLYSKLQTGDLLRQSTCSSNQFSKLQGLDPRDLARYKVESPPASIAKDKSIANLENHKDYLRDEILDSH